MKTKFVRTLSLAFATCVAWSCSNKEAPKPSEPAFVAIETSMGTITVELDTAKAPLTAENFLDYVDGGHYDGTLFHRVMDDFMIQGGGFTKVGTEYAEKATRAPIKNEASNGLRNFRGTVAMARTDDPHSATSQFFINLKDNGGLNPGGFSPAGYAVFGKVIEGMDVVDKIRAVKTGTRIMKSLSPSGDFVDAPAKDVPLEDVVIISVKRVEANPS